MAAMPKRHPATLILISTETLVFMLKASVRGHGTRRFRVSRRPERINRRLPVYRPTSGCAHSLGWPRVMIPSPCPPSRLGEQGREDLRSGGACSGSSARGPAARRPILRERAGYVDSRSPALGGAGEGDDQRRSDFRDMRMAGSACSPIRTNSRHREMMCSKRKADDCSGVAADCQKSEAMMRAEARTDGQRRMTGTRKRRLRRIASLMLALVILAEVLAILAGIGSAAFFKIAIVLEILLAGALITDSVRDLWRSGAMGG